ncbi:MAG TPA: hypothetical protein VFG50_04025 [Rhodothermales bacterium]|nr:hypothetical protein [Rhodothermales bacterium]
MMDSYTEETARAYSVALARYRDLAVRLQLLAQDPGVEHDFLLAAADEVAALGRELGDLRGLLAAHGVQPPLPEGADSARCA